MSILYKSLFKHRARQQALISCLAAQERQSICVAFAEKVMKLLMLHTAKSSILFRNAVEARVKNLEAELQERESAFDANLREQLEKGKAASDARCSFP